MHPRDTKFEEWGFNIITGVHFLQHIQFCSHCISVNAEQWMLSNVTYGHLLLAWNCSQRSLRMEKKRLCWGAECSWTDIWPCGAAAVWAAISYAEALEPCNSEWSAFNSAILLEKKMQVCDQLYLWIGLLFKLILKVLLSVPATAQISRSIFCTWWVKKFKMFSKLLNKNWTLCYLGLCNTFLFSTSASKSTKKKEIDSHGNVPLHSQPRCIKSISFVLSVPRWLYTLKFVFSVSGASSWSVLPEETMMHFEVFLK